MLARGPPAPLPSVSAPSSLPAMQRSRKGDRIQAAVPWEPRNMGPGSLMRGAFKESLIWFQVEEPSAMGSRSQ